MNYLDCIPLRKAEEIIRQYVLPKAGSMCLTLEQSLNRVAAADITANDNLPPFRRSTVDGYAVKSRGTFGAEEGSPALLTVAGEILMGQPATTDLKPGQALVIPTGAMLPSGADAVVMIEHTEQFSLNEILISKKAAPGENVVQAGEDVSAGKVIVRKGQKICCRDIALLAACGCHNIIVNQPVTAGIISTGNEIVPVDSMLKAGQVHDVNSHALSAMLIDHGCTVISYGIVEDNYDALIVVIERAAAECDIVITSGGSSVGQRDFSLMAMNRMKPGVLFHGIAVKPGKPTLFAMSGGVPLFGLPGHPSAMMTMFTWLVKPVIQILSGQSYNEKIMLPARISRNVASAPGRDDFISVRVYLQDGQYWAEPVFGRSGIVSVMTEADGIVHIPAETTGLYQGDQIMVDLFQLS